MTSEGNDTILNATMDAPTTEEMNTMIVTNLVNLLQQQNNRLERMEKSQEKILTKVTTQIEEAQQKTQHNTGGGG